ncbi:MAG: hypothetical protein ACK46A_15780 [Akkermansiaceae bacterium]|jgi:hypothetical protein
MAKRKKIDIFEEFLMFQAPDPDPNEEDVWFDIISVGSYIAGIGQRIRGSGGVKDLDLEEVTALNFRYLNGTTWTCTLDGVKSIDLNEYSALYRYASMIQKACEQLQAEINNV